MTAVKNKGFDMNTELQQRINSFFKESTVDSLLLRNFPSIQDSNLQYFSGVQNKDFFFIARKGKPALILANNLEAGNLGNSGFKVCSFSSEKELVSLLKKSLGKKVGLNFAKYPVKNFQNLQKTLKGRRLVDASEAFASLRAVKSLLEVEKIKEACRVSEMAFDYFENFFRQGLTEIEVSEKVKEFFKRMDCTSAFEPIVAFKENSSIPHHECSRKRIENSGVLLMDLGARFEGYCADISRTYFVGKPSQEIQQTYHNVFEAKKLAESLLVPKVKASKISLEVDAFLKKNLNQSLQHCLAHGIGLEEHDYPSGFYAKFPLEIKESMCFAIEPAFYGKDFGIRLEDDCVITAQGAKMLTAAPKELLTV